MAAKTVGQLSCSDNTGKVGKSMPVVKGRVVPAIAVKAAK